MAGEFDNIHQGLTQNGALKILQSSAEELESKSDFYMAVSHLINFPDEETVDGLIDFLQMSSPDTSVLLAQRKAVEVLGRLRSQKAQAVIGQCLSSNDIYMVENAAWALAQLNCQDAVLHQQMIARLADTSQNRRVLIQSLSSLGVDEAAHHFAELVGDEIPSVAGAAVAALAQKRKVPHEQIAKLSDHLLLPNQMDRQSAVQDIIDARAVDLLDDVVKAPVSPAFKLRALKMMLNDQNVEVTKGINLVERMLLDNPQDIMVLHHYEEVHDPAFLINELFCPDFSRCYLAMQHLVDQSGQLIWPLLQRSWSERAHNDYGAHYFFMRLFGFIDNWPEASLPVIKKLLLDAIDDHRPQFKKSQPAALLSLAKHFPGFFAQHIDALLLNHKSFGWQKRFASLQALGMIQKSTWSQDIQPFLLQVADFDPEPLVCFKAKNLLQC